MKAVTPYSCYDWQRSVASGHPRAIAAIPL